jgi:hypothetical protein
MEASMENTTIIASSLQEIQEKGGENNFVVFISDEEKNYYIQFATSCGDTTLYGEAVNNEFLAPEYA